MSNQQDIRDFFVKKRNVNDLDDVSDGAGVVETPKKKARNVNSSDYNSEDSLIVVGSSDVSLQNMYKRKKIKKNI